jgi:ATP-dependent RNA helicase DeaD
MADRLHGDMTQAMRDRVMNKFRKSSLEFLVATDIAARGIDVDDVQVVFNYDLPYDPEDYVHRIGRTGRAGRSGRATSFVAGRELFQIQQIERFTKTRVHRAKVPTADQVEEARANVFIEKVRATLQSGEFVKQDRLVERLLEEGFTSTDIASALIHQLQAGEQAKAAPAPREEMPERAERSAFRERRDDRFQGREQRPQRFRDEPPPRAGRFPDRRDERAPVKKFVKERRIETQPPADSLAKESPGGLPPESPVTAATPPAKFDRPQRFPAPVKRAVQPSAPPEKQSRRTPLNQTRLYMNVGTEMGVTPVDVVGAIMGETGLPPQTVGTVDIRERHLFVDVAADHANAIIAKLNRTRIKGERLKVKVA